MRYENFSYLWPPRPDNAVSPLVLHSFEKRGWVAQIKKNGTCSVIFVSPDKKVTAMSRHNDVHKQWEMTPEVEADFAHLPGKGWYVFVAELLHHKIASKTLKNINYVHDVLVSNGDYLVGKTQEERQDLLQELLLTDDAAESHSHYVVSPSLWVVAEYESNFDTLYRGLHAEEDEGIVMKDPKQKLSLCSRQKSNVAGQIKCRRTNKNFSF